MKQKSTPQTGTEEQFDTIIPEMPEAPYSLNFRPFVHSASGDAVMITVRGMTVEELLGNFIEVLAAIEPELAELGYVRRGEVVATAPQGNAKPKGPKGFRKSAGRTAPQPDASDRGEKPLDVWQVAAIGIQINDRNGKAYLAVWNMADYQGDKYATVQDYRPRKFWLDAFSNCPDWPAIIGGADMQTEELLYDYLATPEVQMWAHTFPNIGKDGKVYTNIDHVEVKE